MKKKTLSAGTIYAVIFLTSPKTDSPVIIMMTIMMTDRDKNSSVLTDKHVQPRLCLLG